MDSVIDNRKVITQTASGKVRCCTEPGGLRNVVKERVKLELLRLSNGKWVKCESKAESKTISSPSEGNQKYPARPIDSALR